LKVSSTSSTPAPEAPTSLRGVVLAGLATIVAFFGGFLTWGFQASLESAAIAPGVVTVQSQRKTVQHLEGGILDAIHVHDGDIVEKGQLLVEIDATASRSIQDRVEMEYWAAAARVERLQAERQGSRTLEFSDALPAATRHPMGTTILETERRILESRWETHEGRIAVHDARVEGLKERTRALKAQAEARRQQLAISRAELTKIEGLVSKGYEASGRLVEERLRAAELEGEYAEHKADIAAAQLAIKEAELATASVEQDRLTEIYSQLKESQTRAAQLREQRVTAKDIVRRAKVLAPQAGVVTDLRVFTKGGVIAPGQAILDIVPLGDELIVEALVNPQDIDSVRVGLDTHVRLTAYNRRTTPTVEGIVAHVSADMLTHDRSGESYFLARIRLTRTPDIVTGHRKAIDYFISPIADVVARALREE
jgi:HlyD family secretion protein